MQICTRKRERERETGLAHKTIPKWKDDYKPEWNIHIPDAAMKGMIDGLWIIPSKPIQLLKNVSIK